MENVPLYKQSEVKNAQKVNFPQIATVTQGTFFYFFDRHSGVLLRLPGKKSKKLIYLAILYIKYHLRDILNFGRGGSYAFFKMRIWSKVAHSRVPPHFLIKMTNNFFFLDFSKIISAVEIAKCTPMFSHFLELFSKSINYFIINVEGPTEPVVRPILYKKQ